MQMMCAGVADSKGKKTYFKPGLAYFMNQSRVEDMGHPEGLLNISLA